LLEQIIGKSEKMNTVLEQVANAAITDTSVYIEGESGTGKELTAKALHLSSKRKDGPFVAINCAAIPETLFESELFGYEKGAFSGANRKKTGHFAQAQGGTLFLDEISEMPLSMQAKLLRAIQEREFFPLGGTRTIKVDVRLIATSNRNLTEAVEKGDFREDLYYRIHVIVINLPPLKQRKDDIPLLARFFLNKYNKLASKNIKDFSSSVLQEMILYDWPGNVRELENTIEAAVAMASKNIITEDYIFHSTHFKNPGFTPLKEAKEEFEKNYLIHLIKLTHGNISKAAELSGKYRADLYELLKKYGLKPTEFRKN
jgi:two-component system, NtrC family, response regulator GlrR